MTPARVSIEAFAEHGGRLDRARAALPQVRHWIDLSTGLSPWAYPVGPASGPDEIAPPLQGRGWGSTSGWLDEAPHPDTPAGEGPRAPSSHILHRLPDPSALGDLEKAAAAVFGSDPALTVAVPGSDLGLRLLATLLPGSAAVVGPGYSGHVAMWSTPPRIVATAAEGAGEAQADTLVLARPNNPDGAMIDPADLARHPRVIVDEAFVDATPESSLAADPRLIVLRSFGKFYGLAGIRLGFVVAPADIAAALRRLLGDWPIGSLAIAIGTAAYRDTGWQAAQRERLRIAAARLDRLLIGAGLTVAGGTALFRLIDTPHRDALFAHLLNHGILTRPFTDRPRHLRFGLPRDANDWHILDTALASWSGI